LMAAGALSLMLKNVNIIQINIKSHGIS
jgi:hypothetical protein